MRERSFILFLIGCMFFVVSQSNLAQAYNEEIPSLDKAKVLLSAAEVTSEAYPDADDVLVDDYTRVQYLPDGRSLELCDSYQKVLTEKGKRDNKEITLNFTIPYDNVSILELEVIKPDGTSIPVDIEAHSNVMVDPSQMGSNIYNPNDKILRVGIPDLQIGDIVHSVTRSETVKTIVPNTWTDITLFEYTSPIKHYTYEIIAPKERPLKKIAIRDEIAGTVKASQKQLSNGGVAYKWEVSNVAQLFPEPDMPSLVAVAQRLLVSTVDDWKEISKWYWNLSEKPLAAVSPQMREKVAEITKGITDPNKKIEAVFRWVSQEIRYLGITIEKEAPGFEPHDVSLTFEQRHGVCRDKAALLVAMLRLAGFDAYPVLIYVGPKRDPEIPMSRFNHAIVAVELKNSKSGKVETILMDPTNESTKDLFPAYLNDRSYLIAKKNGTQLQVSPIIPAKENAVLIDTSAKLDASGVLEAESSIQFLGINDSAYRGYLARTSTEERNQFFEGLVKGISSGAELVSAEFEPKDLLNTDIPLSAKIKFRADNVLVSNNGYGMLNPPYFGTRLGLVNFALGKTGLEKRKYPLSLDFACGVSENLKLELDSDIGKVVAMPEVTTINDNEVTWQGSTKVDNNLINLARDFYINVVEFSPSQYLTLREDLKKMEFDKRKRILLNQEDNASSDIVLLDREVKIDIEDQHTWREEHYYKKQILSYKGKKDAAEIKVSYNTSLEDVKLLEARVTNGDQVKEISENEINVMDASWVASAPRYPATKTLVVSLPSVEIGSVVEYRIEIKKRNQPFFSTLQIFRDFNPLKRKSVTISAPLDMEFNIFTDDNGISLADTILDNSILKHNIIKDDNRKILTWESSEQEPLRRESNLPPAFAMTTMLYVGNVDVQEFVNNAFQDLIEATKNQEKTIELAKNLVKDLPENESKVQLVRDYVAKNIKRVGPSFAALARSAITPADQTLIDGYGNSTDRAILLYTMLEGIGLTPEFVLVDSDLEAKDILNFRRNYPLNSTFDNVLVRIVENGEIITLNDTNQYAKLGATPSDKHLILDRNGEFGFLKINDDLKTASETKFVLTLTDNGDAELNVEKLYYGGEYTIGKQSFSEMTPEERRRYFQERVADLSQGATPIGELETNFESYPGKESFSVNIKNYAVVAGDKMYFDLPQVVGGLAGVKSNKRTNPYSQSTYNRLKIENIIRLPKDFSQIEILPQKGKFVIPNKGGKIKTQVDRDTEKNEFYVMQKVNLRPTIMSAENYKELLQIEKNLSHPSTRAILIKKINKEEEK